MSDWLLSVEDLHVTLPTRRGTVHPVSGVAFDVEEGADFGYRWRIGVRQEHDAACDRWTAPARWPGHWRPYQLSGQKFGVTNAKTSSGTYGDDR